MSVEGEVIKGIEESFGGGLIRSPLGVSSVQPFERFAGGRQVASRDKLGEGQEAQGDAQQQEQAADPAIIFQEERGNGQQTTFQAVETMFGLPLLAIAVDRPDQAQARLGGIGGIDPPTGQAVEVKKSLESDYPRPKAGALRPIHGFATAIS